MPLPDACSRGVRLFRVVGWSMEPTVEDGSLLAVDTAAYRGARRPERGDVVVFHDPCHLDRHLVKRVVAVPGDTVEGSRGRVVVTRGPELEPITRLGCLQDVERLTVPPDHCFVLGDDPTLSRDSRSWGLLPVERIVGQARRQWSTPEPPNPRTPEPPNERSGGTPWPRHQ